MKDFLSIEGLTVEYRSGSRRVHAVNGLDLRVGEGEALGFVGETGAGKTTTALSILRILPDPPPPRCSAAGSSSRTGTSCS